MPIPTFTDMIPPLLNILAAYPDGIEVAKVYVLVAEAPTILREIG